MRKILFLLGIGAVGYGVYKYYIRQMEVLENFAYKITGIKFAETSFENIKLLISTLITNKSDIGFTIISYDLDITLDDKKIAEIHNSNLNQKITANGSSTISFYANFSPSDIIGGGFSLGKMITNLGTTKLSVKGKMGVKSGLLVYSNYPVDITYTLDEFI